MDGVVAAFCGLLGLLFGSFANVVIHRVPAGESIVRPPSACPGCGNPIAPRDNIPILSWLLLRGRCRHCKEPISARYPLVEASMGLVFVAVGYRVGADWALPGYLLFAWVLVVVAVIDVRTRKIPNRLTYPLTPALLVLLVGAALLSGQPNRALTAVIGGVAAFVVLLILALVQPRGMGMGDVKLAGFIGIGLGYISLGYVAIGIFGGFLLGAIGGVVVIVGKAVQKGPLRGQMIPFGPYLAAGALLALLVGGPIIEAYLRSVGLE